MNEENKGTDGKLSVQSGSRMFQCGIIKHRQGRHLQWNFFGPCDM